MNRIYNIGGKRENLITHCDHGGIVCKVDKTDVCKLAAWTSASRIEKRPKNAETPS